MSDDAGGDDADDAGFDEWLDALAAGEAYYLSCDAGHGNLPPRRVCPDCGRSDLREEPLPETGTVETFTTVHVPAPQFADDAPYVTAVVDFGPVRLTGVVREEAVDDDEAPAVAVGDAVVPDRGASETTGEETVVFRPA
ncbi:MAG: Zn-ribbon domain-containing OB-fold protein [Halolamina sp.]